MKWSDITVGQYNRIAEVTKEPDDYMLFNLIEIIFGVDANDLPVKELEKYIKEMKFLNTECKPSTPKKHYTINGNRYDSHIDLTVMTTGQFIDYQNYSKDNKIEQLLSVFITPEGKDYGKDYNIQEVQKDLLEMPITEALSIAFFFKRQFKVFCNLFHSCLKKSIKNLKMDKEKKKEALKALNKVDFYNLVSYPIYLNTVKQLMKDSQMSSTNQ